MKLIEWYREAESYYAWKLACGTWPYSRESWRVLTYLQVMVVKELVRGLLEARKESRER